jgi:hypothetical protein
MNFRRFNHIAATRSLSEVRKVVDSLPESGRRPLLTSGCIAAFKRGRSAEVVEFLSGVAGLNFSVDRRGVWHLTGY